MKRKTGCYIFIQNFLTVTLISIISIFSSPCIASNHIPKAPSQIKFGARVDAAPLSYKEGENWMGYSIDLCKLIFKRYQEDYTNSPESQNSVSYQPQGNLPEFNPVQAAERMDFLKNGRIDILCGATTVTIARMRYVDFTLLTFVSGVSLMKKKETDSSLLFNAKGNNKEGAKITYVGCTEDMEFIDCTTTDSWLTNRFGSAIKPVPKKTHAAAFSALEKGEAQFYAGDRVILENKLRNMPNSSDFDLAPTFFTFEPYAIAIAKGNDLLLRSANSTLAKLYRNKGKPGGIDDIYFNHFTNEQSEMLKKMYQLQAIPE